LPRRHLLPDAGSLSSAALQQHCVSYLKLIIECEASLGDFSRERRRFDSAGFRPTVAASSSAPSASRPPAPASGANNFATLAYGQISVNEFHENYALAAGLPSVEPLSASYC